MSRVYICQAGNVWSRVGGVSRWGSAPPSSPGGPSGAGSARPLGCAGAIRPAHPAFEAVPLIVASSAQCYFTVKMYIRGFTRNLMM